MTKKSIQKECDSIKAHKILIVEDETLIALNLKRYLEKQGYHVLEPVASGEDALKMINNGCPTIILLDIRLSGEMTGLDVARNIGSPSAPILIIFMTGYITPEIKAEAMQLNPVAFLEKPVDVYEIIKVLGNL